MSTLAGTPSGCSVLLVKHTASMRLCNPSPKAKILCRADSRYNGRTTGSEGASSGKGPDVTSATSASSCNDVRDSWRCLWDDPRVASLPAEQRAQWQATVSELEQLLKQRHMAHRRSLIKALRWVRVTELSITVHSFKRWPRSLNGPMARTVAHPK
jgi:hypothetical protein